jgi:pimeloyl-ACP methyl ester carboxylesterase
VAGDARRVPVLIVPGFLSSASEYEGMADALRRFDASADVSIVPLRTADWYPTLAGGDFRLILDAVDAAATEALRRSGCSPDDKKLRVVGHSAGGWLARTWLGSAPYKGRVYGGARKTTLLLTLGTPHYSLERYPFGRVPEKLFDDDDAGVGRLEDEKKNLKNARADDDTPWTASRAAQSTLALTNFRYPGAFEAGVRYVSVCGRGVVGSTPRRWLARTLGLEKNDQKENEKETNTRFFASVGAGVSYAASCGSCDGVDGDGVTPLLSAMLAGGGELVLEGVTHKPKPKVFSFYSRLSDDENENENENDDDAWYGAPRVVHEWAREVFARDE